MSNRPSMRGAGRPVLIDRLHNRQAFKTSGSLSAVAGDAANNVSTGRMTGNTLRTFQNERNNRNLDYVVMSYATPIAWVTRDGAVVIPADRYSVTTTKQQGIVGTYLP